MTHAHLPLPPFTEEDTSALTGLRKTRPARRTVRVPQPTIGARIADAVAETLGSWRFILLQSLAIAVWMIGNAAGGSAAWDPYPFILLNLLLSFQAAYAGPVIMMSQNRQAAIDSRRAESDYHVNLKAELEIELLHQKIDLLKEKEIVELTRLVRTLCEQRGIADGVKA
jgi:uncharacterized membrane protein